MSAAAEAAQLRDTVDSGAEISLAETLRGDTTLNLSPLPDTNAHDPREDKSGAAQQGAGAEARQTAEAQSAEISHDVLVNGHSSPLNGSKRLAEASAQIKAPPSKSRANGSAEREVRQCQSLENGREASSRAAFDSTPQVVEPSQSLLNLRQIEAVSLLRPNLRSRS